MSKYNKPLVYNGYDYTREDPHNLTKGIIMEIKLFRFSLPEEKEVLYIYSIRSDEEFLRKQFLAQDHGDIDSHLYTELAKEGSINRIVDIRMVPPKEKSWMPYNSWELSEFEMEIEGFFNPPEEYR